MTNVLAIGAHPDDIELGCGGTIARHIASGDTVVMLVVTQGEAGSGDTCRRVKEQRDACQVLGVDHLVWGGLPDGRVSNHELSLVHLIEKTISEHRIDRVYTHGSADSHQDHRSIAVATWGAARHAPQILCYDSPSSVGFTPSIFTDITDTLSKKLEALSCHSSQVDHSVMASASLVSTQAGYRGFQARVEAAEGFEPHRILLAV